MQFNQQQAARIYLPSIDDIDDRPIPSSFNSWYNNQLDDIQDNEQQEYADHLWKRLVPELAPLRQRRRFGNTRYGRSLPNNFK